MKEQHTTKNIIPPQATFEALQRDFTHCFDKDGNFDIEKFKQEIAGAEINFSKESYGMDWLGKSYARVRATDPATTLLKEDTVWNSKEENKNSENLLIKGDNLEVLKHLSHAYHEQIKMIYIDPPYNTGTDGFVYEDDRKFTPEEFADLAGVDLEQAKRILDFVDSKSNSHSAWLSFMYPRLYIARQLLKDDGVIFLSIDDNEVAQLRILMDEVFGPGGFVAKIPWRKRTAKSDVPYGVSQDFEWILVYAKVDFLAGVAQERKYYSTPDFPNERWRLSDLTTQKGAGERPNSAFEMVNPKNGKKYPYNQNRTWAVTKDTFKDYYDRGKIVFPGDYDFLNITIPAYRVFESEDKAKAKRKYGTEESVKAISTLLSKDVGLSEDGNKDIVELFESKIFSFPKPVSLIKYLVDIVNSGDENSIFLDFFAGSGTTGHAVTKLNAEDGGNRKYILVSLPEKIDPKKSKAAFDFVKNTLKIKEPTIFDITKERLVRASKKTKEDNKDSELIAGVDFGFKVFETAPLWDGYADEPAEYSANLKMFDVAKLKDSDLTTLFTTWKTFDGIPLTTPLAEINLGGYTGYYGDGKLYLVHSGFTAKHLTALLKAIDTDTTFSPATIILFGYHFESARMREIAENVKSYTNKKSIDIECITRY